MKKTRKENRQTSKKPTQTLSVEDRLNIFANIIVDRTMEDLQHEK